VKKTQKPQLKFTKRQLSRWQQQQKRRRRILLGLGIFIAAVLVIVGAVWYISQYQHQPLKQTVIEVNDTKFNMNYYIKTLKIYGGGERGWDVYLADEVVEIIVRNELVRQEAMKLGVSVSNEEVDKELKSCDPPLSDDYRDVVRVKMLVGKLRDEYFEQRMPLFAEQRQVMAMFLENESQAAAVRTRIEAGEEFTKLASELSLESFSREENGDLGWQPKGVLTMLLGTSALEEYIFSSEVRTLSQPIYDEETTKGVGWWLIKVVRRERGEEKAQVYGILLGSEEEAQRVKGRLEAGEDFGELAKQFSQHDESKEDDGKLGWLTPSEASPVVDEFVFGSELGLKTVSEPIRDDTVSTKGGYWLIKVVDKDDNRRVKDSDRDLLKAEAVKEWVETPCNENKIENYLDYTRKAWAIHQAMKD